MLLAGISRLGLWFASLTSLIVELDLKDVIRRRRSMQDIANMREHIIICGAGRTGRQVAQELEPVTQNYVVIERDTLGEARIPQETGLIVIAMRKKGADESDFVFNPSADTSIESGDEVIVLGEIEQIEQLRVYLN